VQGQGSVDRDLKFRYPKVAIHQVAERTAQGFSRPFELIRQGVTHDQFPLRGSISAGSQCAAVAL
jgi:hypothetical protein